ncbi:MULTISPECIES: glycerol-3-phosphate dehydrogenase/oxidase [Microbacterium]|uniref:glycerol-3-phosphate dehydrogenase/oxidase n=1 Tax=Microbacterium TaxID=33882 RepID=UPI00278B2E5F|nr:MULTISPECIES: glycerol-3-phosphate dehydrogenase/oxidase [Microbacterium]MDQ1085359.1 glycerol-3-phosphate dehydrogenase [Microbacterium sp. SORGH_AS_0344]MDQ1169336.1 glycerol-3-phosphate dehydrogenase [Microbacterium proteolyticum]
MHEHAADRGALFSAAQEGTFDLLVIGGGVNGLATAWDAALRGLSVAIVEKDDWGSGTSSWSSRLVHGGLKYLEHLEFGLVYESLRDREWLLNAAPHLVRPLAFIMPFYRTNQNGPVILRLGMFLYDVLSVGKSVPNHRILSRAKTIEREPGIIRTGLLGSGVYYDAQVAYAERLCVELMLAATAAGARAANYTRAESFLYEDGRVTGARVRDRETDRTFDIRAGVTVNAAGPWIDEVLAGTPMGSTRLNGGTKGTHLVVDRFPGAPTDECVYYEARTDGRQVLVIPWLDRCLIGSTDKRFEGDLDRAMPDDEEIDYILTETNTVFPDAELTRDSVAFAYTGVRPLPYKPDGAEGTITRKHIVKDHAPEHPGLITLIGGKLTTFRTLGEHATDAVMKRLGRTGRSRTRTVPLPGAAQTPRQARAAIHRRAPFLASAEVDRLVDVYGSRAERVIDLVGENRRGGDAVLLAEVELAVREEQAVHLRDVLARRTMLGLDNDLGVPLLDGIADHMARLSGWDGQRRAAEIEQYHSYIERLINTERGERIGAFTAGN